MRRLLVWPFRLISAGRFFARRLFAPSEKDWLSQFCSLADEIDGLNESTEAEFLEIGSKLQYFYQTSKEISQISASAAELLAGEEIAAAIDGLRRISANMERVASDSQHHSEQLRTLLQMVEDVTAALRGFQRYVQKLNLLCVATRIETAHLGSIETDFETLADDIQELTREIGAQSDAILSRLESLASLIRQNLSRILKIEDCQRGHTRTVLEHTTSSLAGLVEQYEMSLSTAKQIASNYEALSGITGEIVCSVQFHDITRQQIEHVAGSLRRLTGPKYRMEKELSDLCELQSVQMRFAGTKLTEAVEGIIGNLQSTAAKIVEITGELLKLSGDTGQEGTSFLCKTGERLSYAGAVLRGYGEKNRDLGSAMGSIGGHLNDMSSFVGKIRQIGLAIRLIALNSIVKSSHVGDRGAALGVLANEIHGLSLDTGRQTQMISDAFESITSSTLQLSAVTANENGSGEVTADEMIETLDLLMKSLSVANNSVTSQMAVITKKAGALVSEIGTAASAIHVHERASKAINEIASRLDTAVTGLRASSRSMIESALSTRRTELMIELEHSYTMNSEREIHQLVSGEAGLENSAGAPVSGAGAGLAREQSTENADSPQDCDAQEFGDNVELF